MVEQDKETDDVLMDILAWGIGVLVVAVLYIAAGLLFRYRRHLFRYHPLMACSECASAVRIVCMALYSFNTAAVGKNMNMVLLASRSSAAPATFVLR